MLNHTQASESVEKWERFAFADKHESKFFGEQTLTELTQKRGIPELSVSYLDRHWKKEGGGGLFPSQQQLLSGIQYMCFVLQKQSCAKLDAHIVLLESLFIIHVLQHIS